MIAESRARTLGGDAPTLHRPILRECGWASSMNVSHRLDGMGARAAVKVIDSIESFWHGADAI